MRAEIMSPNPLAHNHIITFFDIDNFGVCVSYLHNKTLNFLRKGTQILFLTSFKRSAQSYVIS